MSTIKIPALALGAVAVLALSSCGSKMKEMPASWFATNPNPLEVVGKKLPAVVTGNIPAKAFVKNAVVTVTPVLVYDGMEAAATPAVFQGEDVRGNNATVSYQRGGLMTVPASYVYEPAMQQCELYLDFAVDQNGKRYALPRVKVANGAITTATLASAADVAPALTPDQFQRIINEKYAADIHFLINQAVLRQSELKSEGVTDLNSVITAAAADPFREIKELNISSYASPEGALDLNTRLAENREKATRKYLEDQLQKDKITEFGELTAQFTPEDWEGFQTLVDNSDIQDKELILSVLSMYKEPEVREREIRNMSAIFEQLADQILPQLRKSRITASIDIIGKSDNEIRHGFDENPADLTVEEMLYAATLTDDPVRRAAIYDRATQQYPADYRGWNNLGLMQYEAGDYAEAKKSFDKAARLAPRSAEVKMNQGLVALVGSDYDAANSAFGQAAGAAGLGDAMGVYYIEQGDYRRAVNAFGDSKTNNAAIAQILAKDYAKARTTLNAITAPNAETYYLKAVAGARMGDTAAVLSNLSQLRSLSPELYQRSLTDPEFAAIAR